MDFFGKKGHQEQELDESSHFQMSGKDPFC